jgi:multicomponent Na+:H+ antiporter subunit D
MTPHALLTLPLLIPLATLALCIVLSNFVRAQRIVSITGSVLLLASSVALLCAVYDGTVLATQFGSWRAPFGITFVADLLSAAMVLITGVMAVTVSVYDIANGDRGKRAQILFHPLYHGLLLGVVGAFLTGDIFNLYVWFEIMLISSFGLLVLERTPRQLDAGVKYAILNLVATSLFLMSVGFLYGLTGTLNMADLARTIPTVNNQGLVTTLAILFLLAFGAKAAVFPLFFWLPAAYPAASAPVVAIFAALLTKVGVYALLRIGTLLFTNNAVVIGAIVSVVAILTMVTGVLGAASHFDVRRILSFHIISQIGYMLIGLAVGTPLAVAGSILYVIHHIIVKANLFLIAGVMRHAGGSFDLKKLGGLYRLEPLLAALFMIPAMSLAGLPPFSGFWAKFVLIEASLEDGHAAIAATALVVGLLTLYSMVKIWNEAFWKSPSEASQQADSTWRRLPAAQRWSMLLPIIGLASITLTIGLCTEPFLKYSIRAADQLLKPVAYMHAVSGQSSRITPTQTMESKP